MISTVHGLYLSITYIFESLHFIKEMLQLCIHQIVGRTKIEIANRVWWIMRHSPTI